MQINWDGMTVYGKLINAHQGYEVWQRNPILNINNWTSFRVYDNVKTNVIQIDIH